MSPPALFPGEGLLSSVPPPASTVKRFLVENHRIDSKRIIAQGFGADKPIADNKTPQGRTKNRRIDVVILERAQ